ncbi:MAG: leucine-rich repeat domain-containing protein [Alloprevotella sp.]|nr:leucine-rich repeat domain-containing protein [Alloprevotella sp.]
MNKTYFNGRISHVLLCFLLSFSCLIPTAQAVDWGTNIFYSRPSITKNGIGGRFYCIQRPAGGLTIVGIKLNSKPANGDVIIIPDAFGSTRNDSVYAIYRCGQGYNYQIPLKWENAPDQFGLSLPGTIKEVAPATASAVYGYSDAVPNTALTELIIRPTASNPDMRICRTAFIGITNLAKVTLGRGVRYIDDRAFQDALITDISDLPEGLETIGDYSFNKILVNRDLILPSTLTKIGDYGFGNLRSEYGWFFHNQLVIPQKMKYIGNYVFCGSRKVGMKLDIPEGVETIGGYAFANTFISEITLPSTLKEIKLAAFREMMMLEKATFKPNTVLEKLSADIFFKSPNLRYVDMSQVNSPALTLTNVSRLGETSVFRELKPYTVVYLPKSSTNVDAIADGEENFVQYDGSAWKCKNFVAYDSYDAYLPANINYSTNFPTLGGTLEENGNKQHYAPNQMTPEEKAQFAAWKAALPATRGCDYELPLGFTATSAVYKRALSSPAKDGLLTVSLPYSSNQVQAGLTIFKLVSEKELIDSHNNKGLWFLSLDDNRLTPSMLTEAERSKCLTANYAYIAKVADATALGSPVNGYYTLFSSTNAAVPSTPTSYTAVTASDGQSTWSFVGHPMNISNATASSEKFYTFTANTRKWHPIKASNPNGYVHSFRGALKYTGTDASYAKVVPQIIEGNTPLDTTTGLNSVAVTENASATVYTLDGRKLGTSLEALPAGIYVVGGKKVMK